MPTLTGSTLGMSPRGRCTCYSMMAWRCTCAAPMMPKSCLQDAIMPMWIFDGVFMWPLHRYLPLAWPVASRARLSFPFVVYHFPLCIPTLAPQICPSTEICTLLGCRATQCAGLHAVYETLALPCLPARPRARPRLCVRVLFSAFTTHWALPTPHAAPTSLLGSVG